MISTDRGLFKEDSEVRQRIVEYGGLAEELHVIVFSKQNSQTNSKFQIPDSNVFVYPTNSFTKFNYVFDAIKIGKTISKPDLITTQDAFECGYVGYTLSRFFGCKLQLQIHTDFLSPYFAVESILNKIRVRLAKFLISKADGIRVVSERIKKSIIENCKLKIENSAIAMLPIFVDIEKIKNTPIKTDLKRKYAKFEFIILMAGRLTREKNIGLALEVFSAIKVRYPTTGLVIVGDGPEKENLKSKIKNLKLGDSVALEDWSDDITSYYKTANIFLLTSNYEGYGRTVIEAMAADCPVVMTDVGLAGDIVKNGYNGMVAPVKDRQKLFDAINLLVTSSETVHDFIFAFMPTFNGFPTKEEYLEQYKKSWEACFSG